MELLSSGLEERHQDRDQQDVVPKGWIEWAAISSDLLLQDPLQR